MYLVYPPSYRWFDHIGCSGTPSFWKDRVIIEHTNALKSVMMKVNVEEWIPGSTGKKKSPLMYMSV